MLDLDAVAKHSRKSCDPDQSEEFFFWRIFNHCLYYHIIPRLYIPRLYCVLSQVPHVGWPPK